MSIFPSAYLMCRPSAFGFNSQTGSSNAFQQPLPSLEKDVNVLAQQEFDNMAAALLRRNINLVLVQDTLSPVKPDAVFPNNWFSAHGDGSLIVYPMEAENRRTEVREDVLYQLEKKYGLNRRLDLRSSFSENKFLEGTGSMVFDHINRKCFASISSRTHPDLIQRVCSFLDYRPVIFNALHGNGSAVYHTNVILSISDTFAIFCADAVPEFELVLNELKEGGREMVLISKFEMENFAGNVLQVVNRLGEKILVMSKTAYTAFSATNKAKLDSLIEILSVEIPTIERVGGGSARCMLAELFTGPSISSEN